MLNVNYNKGGKNLNCEMEDAQTESYDGKS